MQEIEYWQARTIAAESRLAEIQRGVDGLTRWRITGDYIGDPVEFITHPEGELVYLKYVLALLQPQGQAMREVKSAPVEGNITREEARAAVIAVMKANEEFERQCFHKTLTSEPSEEAKAFYDSIDKK